MLDEQKIDESVNEKFIILNQLISKLHRNNKNKAVYDEIYNYLIELIDIMKNIYSSQKLQNENLTKQLSQSDNNKESKINKLKEHLSESDDVIDKISKDNKFITDQNRILTEENIKIKKQMDELMNHNLTLNTFIDNMKKDFANKDNSDTTCEKKINNICYPCLAKKKEINSLTSQLLFYQQKIDTLSKRKKELEIQNIEIEKKFLSRFEEGKKKNNSLSDDILNTNYKSLDDNKKFCCNVM